MLIFEKCRFECIFKSSYIYFFKLYNNIFNLINTKMIKVFRTDTWENDVIQNSLNTIVVYDPLMHTVSSWSKTHSSVIPNSFLHFNNMVIKFDGKIQSSSTSVLWLAYLILFPFQTWSNIIFKGAAKINGKNIRLKHLMPTTRCMVSIIGHHGKTRSSYTRKKFAACAQFKVVCLRNQF